MKELPKKYKHAETEKKWQQVWDKKQVYAWNENTSREDSFVIDTPPPTVSGVLHMGHIFSYTQADFIARYKRMSGKNVFYPMGFDDNGLPTERLVEKVKKVRATDMSREDFIKLCEGVSEGARNEFRRLFKTTALSVDWKQEYHTISDESRKIAQLSFLELYNRDEPKVYRKLQPMLWDPIDQTALAQAEIEDKEMDSFENYIQFGIITDEQAENPSSIDWNDIEKVEVMTTRPELLAACVAMMIHPDDKDKFAGKKAVTPLFNVIVDIVADEKVDKEKGSGFVMCCTFGDETDIEWWREHDLETRVILNKYGKIDFQIYPNDDETELEDSTDERNAILFSNSREGISSLTSDNTLNIDKTIKNILLTKNKKVKAAREKIIELLEEAKLTTREKEPITHAVKCAERSGAALEILPTQQWFIKILDQKEELKKKAAECNWHPAYMKIRMDQWIDGLSWDWCISRQRYFGVPFPIWYSKRKGEEGKIIVAKAEQLPCNPLVDLPEGYTKDEVTPEVDVMDTWATSSVSPQLSSKGIATSPPPLAGGDQGGGVSAEQMPDVRCQSSEGDASNTQHIAQNTEHHQDTPPYPPRKQGGEGSLFRKRGGRDGVIQQGGRSENPYILNASRHEKLFPADLRPQAHEIIRTWAFYTIVKAHLHEDKIPWKNLMISGWCLASDKTKMSKSKGNVVTPVDLIEEKGADVVRYWSSTSRLGTDTAFSEDVLKIGKKLVTKIWNASKFAAIHLDKLEQKPINANEDVKSGIICETLDLWILTRLHRAIVKATDEFEKFEYCNARAAVEDFFWNDFCDNYLEMVKGRSYNEDGANNSGQQSAIHTIYHCLEAVLRLFAPIVPHVTEELYSHIFDDKYEEIGSIHARGTWIDSSNYPVDETSESAGIAARNILDVVRKMKAEKNVSIKYPLNVLRVSGVNERKSIIEKCFSDLANVTNAKTVKWAESGCETKTEDGLYTVSTEFAAESDAA